MILINLIFKNYNICNNKKLKLIFKHPCRKNNKNVTTPYLIKTMCGNYIRKILVCGRNLG